MATINQTLCPTIIDSGVSVTKIETKLQKGRKNLKWQTGETISKAEMKIAALAVLDMINDCDGNELPSTQQMAAKIGYPEAVVEKLKQEIFATLADFHAQLKAEGK